MLQARLEHYTNISQMHNTVLNFTINCWYPVLIREIRKATTTTDHLRNF
jgi:hypothetical protein